MQKDIEYDGFYFLPGNDDNELNFSFFKFTEKKYCGKPVDSTSIGDMYYVAFFRRDDAGLPVFDESFEAIFADPTVYVNGLIGSDLYGCVLRKTDKSKKWWNDYLTSAKKACKLMKSDKED